MNTKEFEKKLLETQREFRQFIEYKLPTIVGVEAVDFFKDSFVNEGFTDNFLVKWKEVERRIKTSPWYGFTATKTETGSRFSTSATKRDVLTGETGDLQESIDYDITADGVSIKSDKVYASVHNNGEKAKVFGKHEFTMPKRQFMGRSATLDKQLLDEIEYELKEIWYRIWGEYPR